MALIAAGFSISVKPGGGARTEVVLEEACTVGTKGKGVANELRCSALSSSKATATS